MAIVWTLIAIWVGIVWLYPSGMHAKKARDAGTLTTFWIVHFWPMIVFAYILDLAFNYSFGWTMFLEAPWHTGEKLFSGRVQWHVDNSTGWRRSLALFWAKQLNVFDDHIKL